MGLFNFNKPKWQHKNPAVRLEAVAGIDPGETEILAGLIREDQDRDVRRAAVCRLADPAVLERLEAGAGPEDLPVIIARKEELLFARVAGCGAGDEWRGSLEQITSAGLLARIAVEGGQPDIRAAAVDRIDDQRLLAGIVRQNCGPRPAMAAMAKINDEALLADLAESAAGKASRRLAAERLADIERQRQPDERHEQNRKLDALLAEATGLAGSEDPDTAALRFLAIKDEWRELGGETHHAHDRFTRICDDFDAGYEHLLALRKSEKEQERWYEQQFLNRLDEICNRLDRLSCSTDKDAEAAKEQAVADWDAAVKGAEENLVPGPDMEKRFAHGCRVFDANREVINLERGDVDAIEEQCAEVRQLIADCKLKKAAALVEKTEKSLARLEFKFFNKTAIARQLADIAAEIGQTGKDLHERNLARRREICEALEGLIDLERHNQIEQRMQALKQDWRDLVRLEDAEANRLEERFQAIAARLNEKLKTLESEQEWQLWANLSLKEKLIETVAGLDQQDDMETVVRVIKESQARWKEIGHVPHDKSQESWEAFQDACNRNFERARPYLEEEQNKKAAAMERRREICALAAELALSEDWGRAAQTFKQWQEEWKNLPHGSRKEEQELFTRFRASCDGFFERRKEQARREDEQRRQHLAAKEQLCEQAERLAAAPQPDYAGEFKKLQNQWKKTGPAPRNREGELWQRFRAACDTFFNWLEQGKLENLKRKEELCEQVEKMAAEATPEDNQKEIAARINEIQRQWKEIGPVPQDRSDAVWERFRKTCDAFFAARKEQIEKEMELRRQNQAQKEELLAKAEELAGQGAGKEIAEQLQELQKQWFAAGAAPRAVNSELNDRFKGICNAFFEGRRQYFTDLKNEQLENLRKKESLCLLLENIIGNAPRPGTGKGLSLAEELKQAMEANFLMSGRRNDKKAVDDEVKKIEQEWQKTGPVPHKQFRAVTDRYRKALDAYYKGKRGEKG